MAARDSRPRRPSLRGPYLQEQLGRKIAIGREILTVQNVFGKIFNEGTAFARDGSQFDRLFEDGDSFDIGDIPVTVLHVPGHTPAEPFPE